MEYFKDPPAAGVLHVAAVRRQDQVGLAGEEQRTMKSLCHLSGSMARRHDGKVMQVQEVRISSVSTPPPLCRRITSPEESHDSRPFASAGDTHPEAQTSLTLILSSLRSVSPQSDSSALRATTFYGDSGAHAATPPLPSPTPLQL
ncbi:unnamed protein product [Pleuronectes platessa]|uniref:Uncharacterized protein n=1 Tax=Pleuronectes platessa TaxID=8262 RepID=A0A9N7V120_PLEPL|nr:unnamed protein product [Pleuronectes platessa]